MADLPECRLTLANKPFKFCGWIIWVITIFGKDAVTEKPGGYCLLACAPAACMWRLLQVSTWTAFCWLSLALPTCEGQWTQSTLTTAPLFALPLSVYRTCLIRLTFITHCTKLILTGLRFHLTLPAKVERGK